MNPYESEYRALVRQRMNETISHTNYMATIEAIARKYGQTVAQVSHDMHEYYFSHFQLTEL